MNPKSAHQKGKQLEDWVVQRLILSGLDKRAYRQKGSGSGLDKGDIWNDLGICFECKNTKAYPSNATFKQVKREAMGYQKEVVVWHPPQKPLDDSRVIINWYYFEELLKRAKEPALKEPDRAFSWKMRQFIQLGKQILKELEH